jgi:hypothetical protein
MARRPKMAEVTKIRTLHESGHAVRRQTKTAPEPDRPHPFGGVSRWRRRPAQVLEVAPADAPNGQHEDAAAGADRRAARPLAGSPSISACRGTPMRFVETWGL